MQNLIKKHAKRKLIAKSTCNLFLEKGYVNITISEIAKVAGIGKGTIYEYFENKEDIIFELMACLQEDYDPKLMKKLESDLGVKEKVLSLFDIYLSDDETVQIQRKIYKEFLSIYITHKTDAMDIYNKEMKKKYCMILENIFKDAIQKGEISKKSRDLIPSIFATFEGFFINSHDKSCMIDYVNNLFDLLQITHNTKEF